MPVLEEENEDGKIKERKWRGSRGKNWAEKKKMFQKCDDKKGQRSIRGKSRRWNVMRDLMEEKGGVADEVWRKLWVKGG